MKPLELDLQKIKLEGEVKENQNYRFRSFLKGISESKLDRQVHQLYEDVSGRIDCTACGNCCTAMYPSVSRKDIKFMAQWENESEKTFIEKFTKEDTSEKLRFLNQTPCRYFSDCKCTIYENRPKDCRSFPHLHKSLFVSRLYSVIENYSICPIVYNVFEELKRIYRFR